MKLYPEHKTSLKYYAAIFLIFGLILLLCGTMFENGSSEIAEHQETMYRQDQVHYWAGIPFIFLAIISILFLVLELNVLLKLCICFDFICVNIAIFVIIVEGPDWKKYAAKSHYYSHSSDIDYRMLKPIQAYGRYGPLAESSYTSAMHYSGTWVIVAILSILLGIEAFLTHLKVYCGIESIYGYLTGYELIYPEITLKTARPIEKFQCKGCQTRLPTPNVETSRSTSPIKKEEPNIRAPPTIMRAPPTTMRAPPTTMRAPPTIMRAPPTIMRAPIQQSATDGIPQRTVSPTLSDISNASNAFYVCHEGGGIKLIGYKPHRHQKNNLQMCTHQEEEELPPEHYHFCRKHPNDVEDPNSNVNLGFTTSPQSSPSRALPPLPLPDRPHSNIPSPTDMPLGKDPQSYGSPLSPSQYPLVQHPHELSNIPTPPPLPPMNPNTRGESNSNQSSPSIPSPPLLPPLDFTSAGSRANNRNNLSPSIHKPTAFSPVQPKVNRSPIDRSPGKYPPVADIFPPPPSTLSAQAPGREKGKVSLVDPRNEPESKSSYTSNEKPSSKLETLF